MGRPLLTPRLRLARRRSALRKDSAGAAMFIVAVTLAMLAAMGVYGLSSARNDVRAAGHYRQAVQSQHVAEMAGMAVAESITPSQAKIIMDVALDPAKRSNLADGTSKCRSVNKATTNLALMGAESCVMFGESTIATFSTQNQNKFAAPTNIWDSCTAAGADTCPLFDKNTFQVYGTVNGTRFWRPDLRVEVGNFRFGQGASGMGMGQKPPIFMTATMTVFVDIREDDDNAVKWQQNKPESVALARGQIVVGPIL